jgi:hypothetical protein
MRESIPCASARSKLPNQHSNCGAKSNGTPQPPIFHHRTWSLRADFAIPEYSVFSSACDPRKRQFCVNLRVSLSVLKEKPLGANARSDETTWTVRSKWVLLRRWQRCSKGFDEQQDTYVTCEVALVDKTSRNWSSESSQSSSLSFENP